MNRICGIGRLLGGRARLLGIQELLLTDLKLTNMLELNSVSKKTSTARSSNYYRVFDAPLPHFGSFLHLYVGKKSNAF